MSASRVLTACVLALFAGDSFGATTKRASIGAYGNELVEELHGGVISRNGRYVAISLASTAGGWELWVKDLVTGGWELVSPTSSGGVYPVVRESVSPSMSADGRYVASAYREVRYYPCDWKGCPSPEVTHGIAVADRLTGTRRLYGVDLGPWPAPPLPTGASDPSISADGRFVAYHTGVQYRPAWNGIVRRDLATGEVIPVGSGSQPVTSDDGRYVAYLSLDGTVVQHDIDMGVTLVVSEPAGGASRPSMSGDGRFVGYGRDGQAYVRDVEVGLTRQVSVRPDGGPANGPSESPWVSADGRFVAFSSRASDLAADDVNGNWDVFVIDLRFGWRWIASRSVTHAQVPEGAVGGVSISGDGRSVTFNSYSSALVPGDAGTDLDIFVRTGVGRTAPTDFTGDDEADYTVFRPSTGAWYVLPGDGADPWAVGWGADLDVPVAGDYDGDGRSDVAVWRPATGVWYVVRSDGLGAFPVEWGGAGDVAVPADYDGDGLTDPAVWRPDPGTWYVLLSGTQFEYGFSVDWGSGARGDRPVPGDYDGDGAADLAVWRPSTGRWFMRLSSQGYIWGPGLSLRWGAATDVPVPADYDGDGVTDVAVYRPSTTYWWVRPSSTGFLGAWVATSAIGRDEDAPVPADYDGDGRADLAVWRPSNGRWVVAPSSTGFQSPFNLGWGLGLEGDQPVGAKR
jgi:Tol biopolymer transport system component